MTKLRREYRKRLWIAVISSGVILGVLMAILKLNPKTEKIVFFSYLFIVAVASLLVDYKLNKILASKYMEITDKYLYEDNDRYIEEMTNLIGDSKEGTLQNIYNLNMGAAYYSKGDFEKSRDFFEKVKGKKIRGSNSFIYWANLALVNYRLGDVDKAEELYNNYLNERIDLRDDDNVGGLFAIVDIFHLGYKGDLKEAEELYHSSRKRFTQKRNRADFDYIWEVFEGFGPRTTNMFADNKIDLKDDIND